MSRSLMRLLGRSLIRTRSSKGLGLAVWGSGGLPGVLPFLDLLSVYWRRPCAGRHLLFFVLPKKSRQKKGAEDLSFPGLRPMGNGNPRSVALARRWHWSDARPSLAQ